MDVGQAMTQLIGLYGLDTTATLKQRLEHSGVTNPSAQSFLGSLYPELGGMHQLSAFNLAKRYQVDRAMSRNEQAEKFAQASEAYQMQALKQQSAASEYAERLGQIQDRLGVIRTQGATSASQASSQREYSQLAKRAMEGTRRYLAELEAFRAPAAPAIDFTFTDPLTGKKVGVDTSFEDIYSGDFDPAKVAREQVMGEFKSLSEQKYQEALDWAYSEWGRPEDYSDIMPSFANLGMTNEAQVEAIKAFKAQRAKSFAAQDIARDYAEAATIAQMGGYTEDIQVKNPFAGRFGEFSYDPSAAFYQQDINAILEDMTSKATERLEIDRLMDKEAVQGEFERRKALAQSQFRMFESQQQRIQAEQQRIEEEKQRTRQQLTAQQSEYSQAMSSFGSVDSGQNGGIQFTDARPI